jgi:hypothetical protein
MTTKPVNMPKHSKQSEAFAVQLTLRMRLIFIYSVRWRWSRQSGQFQQVFNARDRAPLRLFQKGIRIARIRPSRRQIGLAAVFGDVINTPLPPTQTPINQFESPAPPRVKWMRDGEILLL